MPLVSTLRGADEAALYGAGGKLRLPGPADAGRFAGLLPDGKILTAAGNRLYRLTPNGVPDGSSGDNGSIRPVVGG